MTLEAIAGCMYSGKSEELIRRLRRCQIAGQRVLVLKSSLDDRYSKEDVATHVGEKLQARTVRDSGEVQGYLEGGYLEGGESWEVVGLDEVQFLDEGIIGVLEQAAFQGVRVITAGLDLDSDGEPFGPMGRLLAVADSVTKLTAVCVAPGEEGKRCGKPATRSYRIPGQGESQVLVGSEGKYEARCRECWAAGRRSR